MSDITICGFSANIQYLTPKNVNFEFHPAAKLFPLPSDEDRSALRSSIVHNGYNNTMPIIVAAKNNQIVDGRNRWNIVKELESDDQIPVAFVDFPDEQAAKNFALSQNLGRRHLTRDQRDQMINDLIFDGWTTKSLADLFGLSESAVVKISADAREMVEEERNKKIVALVDEGKAQKDVAEVVGVNPATVSRVMQKRNNSELATDGSWLNKRPAIDPVVKPTEIDPLKITSTEADQAPKVDEKLERKVAKRVEQALKAERKALDREYQKRINDAVDTFLTTRIAPVYGKRLELAEEIIKAYEKPIMSKAQYRKILSCLHPDFAVDEDTKKKLDGVFHMFKQFESILVQAKSINLEPIAETVQQFIDSKKAA